jgi:antitoxin YefM
MEGSAMPTLTASEARRNFFPLLGEVNDNRDVIRITSQRGNGVLMSEKDYEAWQTTLYLLSSPANVRHLLESIDQWKSGNLKAVDTAVLDEDTE